MAQAEQKLLEARGTMNVDSVITNEHLALALSVIGLGAD